MGLTFPSTIELDSDLFIHILGQVEDVLLLPLGLSTSRSSTTPCTTATSTSTAARSASEVASF